eukprot:TRINITY_DN1397_c2_g1_i1.p1 TRINITY_DN1397_c2_g1~~TRINITY_DN1397_c2_g1_i1.p1  ORF type:complete len:243 (+),score=79.21 TRINITY_DN1397_c2_g1_i1:58-786(+)
MNNSINCENKDSDEDNLFERGTTLTHSNDSRNSFHHFNKNDDERECEDVDEDEEYENGEDEDEDEEYLDNYKDNIILEIQPQITNSVNCYSKNFRNYNSNNNNCWNNCKQPTQLTVFELVINIIFSLFFALIINYIFHNNWCNAMFKCGCTWPWAGSWSNCNYHNPNSIHCPWCASPTWALWTTEELEMGVMILTYIWILAKGKNWAIAITGSFISFFASGAVVGLIYKIATGYPIYFIDWS